MGEVFTREAKPMEIELIVAEVGDDRYPDHHDNSLYRIKFDGFISNHTGYVAIGGNVDDVEAKLKNDSREGLPAGEALRLGRSALDAGAERSSSLDPSSMEVCLLERTVPGRKFRRLSADEVQGMLDA